jgi:hypothetical protein
MNNKNKIIPLLILSSSLLFNNCEIKKVYDQGEVSNINFYNKEITIKNYSNENIIIKLKGNKKNLEKMLNSKEGIQLGDILEFPIGQQERPIISNVFVYNPYIDENNSLKLDYNQIKKIPNK